MPATTATLLCLVLAVQDGDSLQLRCDDAPPNSAPVTVRLHAVDAPEYGQAFGNLARQALRERVERQQVQLRCVDTDAYGRRVCQVFRTVEAQGGQAARLQDVGLGLVEDGMAWWYRRYSRAQTPEDRARYRAAEEAARSRRAGLWREGAGAVPPWRWRHAPAPVAGSDGPPSE